MQRWRGEPLNGRTLLVWTDQGLGDTIMMLRYLPLIPDCEVVVCCEAPLARLVNAMGFPVILKGENTMRGDVHVPLMSMPFIFGTLADTIPGEPYIKVPRDNKFSINDTRLKVALCWAGMKHFFRDKYRSMRFDDWKPITDQDVCFVSMQKGIAQEQANGFPLIDFMDECVDFFDTAQMLNEVDLVLTVDTGPAHLAGAMGKPVWMLNRFESEWRWNAPWYPSMRIFKQREFGNWAPVITDVALSLEERINEVSPKSHRGVRSGLRDGLADEARG